MTNCMTKKFKKFLYDITCQISLYNDYLNKIDYLRSHKDYSLMNEGMILISSAVKLLISRDAISTDLENLWMTRLNKTMKQIETVYKRLKDTDSGMNKYTAFRNN